jgi:hypothetical protein
MSRQPIWCICRSHLGISCCTAHPCFNAQPHFPCNICTNHMGSIVSSDARPDAPPADVHLPRWATSVYATSGPTVLVGPRYMAPLACFSAGALASNKAGSRNLHSASTTFLAAFEVEVRACISGVRGAERRYVPNPSRLAPVYGEVARPPMGFLIFLLGHMDDRFTLNALLHFSGFVFSSYAGTCPYM